MTLPAHSFDCSLSGCRNGLSVRATNPATARARAADVYAWTFRITNPGELTPFCHDHNTNPTTEGN